MASKSATAAARLALVASGAVKIVQPPDGRQCNGADTVTLARMRAADTADKRLPTYHAAARGDSEAARKVLAWECARLSGPWHDVPVEVEYIDEPETTETEREAVTMATAAKIRPGKGSSKTSKTSGPATVPGPVAAAPVPPAPGGKVAHKPRPPKAAPKAETAGEAPATVPGPEAAPAPAPATVRAPAYVDTGSGWRF